MARVLIGGFMETVMDALMKMYPQSAQERVLVSQNKPTAYIRRRHCEEYAKLTSLLPNAAIFVQLGPCPSFPAPASKNPLAKLEKASMRDLYLDESNKGYFLILRTLERAYKVRSVATIVEDHRGNAALLSLFNLTTDSEASLDQILPVGTVFILKEPYITWSCGELTVRISSPADIIFVYEGHKLYWMVEDIQWKNAIVAPPDPVTRQPKPKTVHEWNVRGNELFREKKVSDAVRCYSIALEKASKSPESVRNVLQLDLAMCYLKLGHFEAALQNAEEVLHCCPKKHKALYRAGRAMCELRKYGQAKEYLETLLEIQPNNFMARQELDRCEKRIAEEGGEFDIHQAHLENHLQPLQKSDCADYVGPVRMAEIVGKGRGVVATADIEPGTLLVVSKALAFTWKEKQDFLSQLDTGKVLDYGENLDLVTLVAHTITRNPNTLGQLVYDLSIGRYQKQKNAKPAELFCDPKMKKEPIADVERIKQILSTNGFGVFINTSEPESELERNLMEMSYCNFFGSGLFVFPSYFNHSCLPNGTWQIFNDVMFIRANRPIKAGEEVFLSYVNWATPFVKKKEYFQHYGFKCSCKLCEEDGLESDKARAKKQQQIQKFMETFLEKIKNGNADAKVAKELRELIQDCKTSFKSAGHELRMLSMMHSWLGIACFMQGKYAEEIQCHLETIRLYGFEPDTLADSLKEPEAGTVFLRAFLCQEVLDVIQPLVGAFYSSKQDANAKKWIQILLALEKLYSGGDADVAKLKYPQIKSFF